MRRLLPALLALLPLALHAYLPSFSQAGYFPAEESPRTVSSLNPGWDFVRGDGYKARVNLPHTLNVVGFEASGGSNYQGPATYEKRFDWPQKGARQFLHFKGREGLDTSPFGALRLTAVSIPRVSLVFSGTSPSRRARSDRTGLNHD